MTIGATAHNIWYAKLIASDHAEIKKWHEKDWNSHYE